MSLEQLVQNRFFRPVVSGVLASILGCASPSGGKGLQESCGSDMECADPYVCDAQKCVGGSGSSCGNDYDCSGKLNCEQGKCVSGNEGSGRGADVYSGGKDGGNVPSGTPLQTQKMVGGVGITAGNTNSSGQVQFIDSGNKETVTITVKDQKTGQAVSGAGVTFLDGTGFELFQVYKKGFVPALGVYGHNSGHEITLVNENYNALTIFEYYQNKNPDEYYALDKYVEWAGNNYLYSGCKTKEEMRKENEYATEGLSVILPMSKGGKLMWGAISYVLNKVKWAEEIGVLDIFPSEAYQIYQAANFTGPLYFKGVSIGKEICNDGIDNDCDKYIDAKDSDCKTSSNCTSHSVTICNNNNVQWKDSCGKLEEVVKQCSTSQTCKNSQCVDNKPSCGSYISNYLQACSNDKEGIFFYGYCSDEQKLTVEKLETCSSGMYCQAYCVDSSGKKGSKCDPLSTDNCTSGKTCKPLCIN